MRARHYDAIILGRSIGSLLTAALLARREMRVLVLGQGELGPSYKVRGHRLLRRGFSLLSATSPTFRRIIVELAQTQRFRRLTSPLDPMFSILSGKIRFEVPPDIDLFSREIEREFPEVRQPIAELYAEISRVNGLVDAAFERDAVWPPGTLFERMETGRLAGNLPLVEDDSETSSLLDRLPGGHEFQQVVEIPALFASHLGTTPDALPPLAIARLHGAWTRGIHHLAGGENELEAFLIERITAHGGAVRLRSKATRLVVRRGRVIGVEEDGEGEMTGADAVVSNWSGEALADLSGGSGITRKAKDTWPHVEAVGGRFIVNLVVHPEAIPEPLGREAFLISEHPELPTVHLTRVDAPASEPREGKDDSVLLVAEMLLPTSGSVHLLGAREAVLAAIRRYLPFIDEQLILVDSPHDGLPVWSYEAGPNGPQRRELDRVHLPETTSLPEPMQWRLDVKPLGYLGLAGEPLRGPITGTYLVGPSVLPALGQEGEVLAAYSVARILTKRDRGRQKMRRQMWTKMETG